MRGKAAGKIFGIGLSKTGTTSLSIALGLLGYRTIDNDVGLRNIDAFDAATDAPVADAFERLDIDYPGSKFIYTVRDGPSWLRSAERHWTLLITQPVVPEQVALFERLYGVPDYGFDASAFLAGYQRHDDRVRGYFAGRDLLILDICNGDGWGPLCRFLDRPEPDVPFPRTAPPAVKVIGPVRAARSRMAYELIQLAAWIAPTPIRRQIKRGILNQFWRP